MGSSSGQWASSPTVTSHRHSGWYSAISPAMNSCMAADSSYQVLNRLRSHLPEEYFLSSLSSAPRSQKPPSATIWSVLMAPYQPRTLAQVVPFSITRNL